MGNRAVLKADSGTTSFGGLTTRPDIRAVATATGKHSLTQPVRVIDATDDAADRAVMSATYRADREVLVRTRLYLCVALWFVGNGLVTLIERYYFPERAAVMTAHYLTDGAVCLAAVVLAHMRFEALPPTRIATLLMSFLLLRSSMYLAEVGETVELLAMAHVTLLCGLMVLLPWGWLCQLTLATMSLASFAIALPQLNLSSVWFYAIVPLVTTAITTVLGAYLLDRVRREDFVRTSERAEKAETAAALGAVDDALRACGDGPDVLERANLLGRESLYSDWTAAWICDEERRELHLPAAVGAGSDLRGKLVTVTLPWSYRTMLADVPSEAVVEVPSADEQGLVSAELLCRHQVASALLVPLRAGDELLGVHVHAYRHRTGSFSGHQRRLALSIAQRTAVALKHARAVAAWQTLSRAKSDALTTMAHELRTPVNVIAGYAELLSDGAFGSLTPAQGETIGRMHRKAAEMREVVDATLDIGRFEAGGEVVTVDAVDMATLFADLRTDLEPLADAAVRVNWHNDLASPVSIDGAKLKMILKNLVGNALKFTARGSVDVSATQTDGCLAVTVRDTGIGIAPADLAVIFGKFRQVDGSGQRRRAGVGLGLHIVKRLIDLLGGTIAVESALGAGSAFTFRIPLLEVARGSDPAALAMDKRDLS